MPAWGLELAAALATVACVFLAVRRSLWQYPVGLLATGLYFGVFMGAHLYASAILQLIFVAVQVYGWWFWLRGDAGQRPAIRVWALRWIVATLSVALIGAFGAGLILDRLTDAATPGLDSLILGLSLAAQFLLDRKVAQHWFVWMAVNVLAIGVYAGRGLDLTALLYAALLINALYGWWVWRRRMGERVPAA